MTKNKIFEYSAKQLAKKIRDRELSIIEVVHGHITLMEEVNPKINAICEKFFDQALDEAKKKTELQYKTAPEELPPLFGVPFSVKEMIAMTGARRTGGNIHYKNKISQKNSTLVQRLLDAGGIPLATSNVPELGFWFECSNSIYGRTNNPYDLDRTCGGSSGGEGALIGAGASPFGLGSDIGGSIRIPANFCGIFGHKPTAKSFPMTGHFPFNDEDFARLTKQSYTHTTTGPMTRKAEDLEFLFDLLCGSDGIDLETRSKAEVQKTKTLWSPFRLNEIDVHFLSDPEIHLASTTSREVSAKVSQTAQTFLELGCNIHEFDRRFFLSSVEIWGNAVKSTKNRKFSELLSPETKIDFKKEFLNMVMQKPNHTFPSLAVALLEDVLTSEKDQSAYLQSLQIMKEKLLRTLHKNSILIMPVHPRVAPRHHHPLTKPFDYIYSGIFTVLGFPAVSVPLGLNSQGVPLGIQLIAAPGGDYLLFRMAEVLENLFGGWLQPDL